MIVSSLFFLTIIIWMTLESKVAISEAIKSYKVMKEKEIEIEEILNKE